MAVALPRYVEVDETSKVLILWLTEVFKRDSKLHRSVVTTIGIVIANVEVRSVLVSRILLEQDTIAVARSLILLVHVRLFARRHLVRRNECDWHLRVPRIVAFL